MDVATINKANNYQVAAPGALDGKSERKYLERPAGVVAPDPALYLYDLDTATRKIGMIVTVEDARTAAEQADGATLPYTTTFQLLDGLTNANWKVFGKSTGLAYKLHFYNFFTYPETFFDPAIISNIRKNAGIGKLFYKRNQEAEIEVIFPFVGTLAFAANDLVTWRVEFSANVFEGEILINAE